MLQVTFFVALWRIVALSAVLHYDVGNLRALLHSGEMSQFMQISRHKI